MAAQKLETLRPVQAVLECPTLTFLYDICTLTRETFSSTNDALFDHSTPSIVIQGPSGGASGCTESSSHKVIEKSKHRPKFKALVNKPTFSPTVSHPYTDTTCNSQAYKARVYSTPSTKKPASSICCMHP